MQKILRIGTRTSPLALYQASLIKKRLNIRYPTIATQIIPLETEGDSHSIPLHLCGGKGIFIRKIEEALLNNTIDLAVHSFKDITYFSPPSLTLSGFIKAESPCDILVSHANYTLNTLPKNAKIGSDSLRRKALLHSIRPDFQVLPIRGNIHTRLQRYIKKDLDAIILSYVSLSRLNLMQYLSEILNPKWFIPAPGQGVIAIQCRKHDKNHCQIARAIGDEDQYPLSIFEMSLLKKLQFDCGFPFGLFIDNTTLPWHLHCFFVNLHHHHPHYIRKKIPLSSKLCPSSILDKLFQ